MAMTFKFPIQTVKHLGVRQEPEAYESLSVRLSPSLFTNSSAGDDGSVIYQFVPSILSDCFLEKSYTFRGKSGTSLEASCGTHQVFP